MSQFRSGEEVLQAARLQVDALGGMHGGLIVEGSDDRKLFSSLCFVSSQIVIAGGKSLVLEAHAALRPGDVGRFVFVVDCDGDVGAGGLRGRPDLIITEHSDIESDLIALGALEAVVGQLVPAVASGDIDAADVAELVYGAATELAAPVGCVRRAARRRSISLSALRQQDMDYLAIGSAATASRYDAALQQVTRCAGLTTYQARQIRDRIAPAPTTIESCNGHDLVEAVRAVLIRDHRISGGKAAVRSVDALLRMSMLDPARRESWGVIARLRRWEAAHACDLLKP